MSDIQRYYIQCWSLSKRENGNWVKYDDHRAEVERLKRMLPPTTHTGLRNGPGEGSWSVFAGTVVEERDEAREEVERLNAEVERLTAERDEARDEVERLTQMTVADFALAEYRKRWPR